MFLVDWFYGVLATLGLETTLLHVLRDENQGSHELTNKEMTLFDDLSEKTSNSMERIRKETLVDEITLKIGLINISRALLDADFPQVLVERMETMIQISINNLPGGSKHSKIIRRIVFQALCKTLGPKSSVPVQQQGEPSVVMFIGLRGSEKDTVCGKYALYHQSMGFKPALVCADTYTAGAFRRLKDVAKNAKVPVYGSYIEINPLRVARQGIQNFKRKNHDLIIVDTNSRHTHYSSLFEEMRQIANRMKPDLVVLVMDSRIGQAASLHARDFKRSFKAGSVVLTNIKDNTKATGAVSSVSAARCRPILLTETGENEEMIEVFDVKRFVRRLLCKNTSSQKPWNREMMGLMRSLMRPFLALFFVLYLIMNLSSY